MAVVMGAEGQTPSGASRMPVAQDYPSRYGVEITQEGRDSTSLSDEALSSIPGRRDHKQMANDYMRMARTFDNNGDLVAAREALEKMRRELTYVDDPRAVAAYHMQLGLLDASEYEFAAAVISLQKALGLYESLQDTVLMASCLLNLGNAYRELGDDTKAIQHYNTALYIYEVKGDDASAALALGYVGNIYKENGERELALSNYYKALALYRKNDFRQDIAISLNSIGEVMIGGRDYDEALPYLLESLALSREIDSPSGIIAATYNLAVIDIARGVYGSALSRFEEVLRRARAVRSAVDVRNATRQLAELHERTGRMDVALQYRKQYDAWKDSVVNQTERERQVRREAARKARVEQLVTLQSQLADKELLRQRTLRNAIIMVIILIGLLTAGVVYYLRQRAWMKRKIQDQEHAVESLSLKYADLDMKIHLIRNQLDPNFLFNSMDSISRLVLAGDNKSASLYLNKLSRFLKLSLENLDAGSVSLDNELMQIESYVQMEQLRMEDRVHLEINVDRAVDGGDAMVPPMILQPFVENALWHGLAHKREGESRHLRIQVKEKRDIVVCTIEDNGVGRERAAFLSGHPVKGREQSGIRQAEQRLRMLDRSGTGSLIRILDLKDRYGNPVGTRVEVMIPLVRR